MEKKLKIIIGSILAVLLIGIIILSLGNNQSIQKVNGEEAKDILDKYSKSVLIDVRTREENAVNGIEGSIVFPYDQIETIIEEVYPDKDTYIIVYCNSGRRSNIAANKLKELGYKNIYDLGGYQNW